MFDHEPGIIGWLNALVARLTGRSYVTCGDGVSFETALWSSLKDERGWTSSIFGFALAVLIMLSVLAVMRKTGIHEEWKPLVGLVVGFVSADLIRVVVLAAWDTRENNLVNKDESEQ